MLSVRPAEDAVPVRAGRHAAQDDLEWVTIAPVRPILAARQEPLMPAPPVPEPQVVPARVEYLDRLVATKRAIQKSLVDRIGSTLADLELDENELAARVRQALADIVDSEQPDLGRADRHRLISEICRELLGLGPLEMLLCDDDVTEIMVNGPDRIFVERAGRIQPVAAAFTGEHHLRRTIAKLIGQAGRTINDSSPVIDTRLPDGTRVNVVLPPVALDGPTMTVRKFRGNAVTMADLVRSDTLTSVTANFLAACVRARLNIVISGAAGSGKTTTLNVMSSFVPSHERIVTIEDVAELALPQEHVVRMKEHVADDQRITAADLLRSALHMRPDRIVVGEVHDGAAVDLLLAMSTGLDGTLTTVRAGSPAEAVARLETMALAAGSELPRQNLREQAASAIDVIVHQSRLRDGSRRITRIAEVTGVEFDEIAVRDLFTFDHGAGVDEDGRPLGRLRPSGVQPLFMQRLEEAGIALPDDVFRDWA